MFTTITPIVVTRHLTTDETAFSRKILGRDDRDPKSEEVPLIISIPFPACPGLELDVKIVNTDSPYVDPVVFLNGHEVFCMDPAGSLEGEYTFEHDGQVYTASLIPA